MARKRVRASPLAFEVLQLFDRWRSAESLAGRFRQFDAAMVRSAVRALEHHSLLERRDRRLCPPERAWKNWSPAAALLHFSTRDGRYRPDLAEVARRLRRRAKTVPMPSFAKHYPGARQIPLPPPNTQGDFPQVLLGRRTWRRFSNQPVRLQHLATLLWLTWGIQWRVDLSGIGRVALKTSPSAGARHPLEVYVLALRVHGLPRGLYHYAPDAHRLELVRRGSSSQQATGYLAGQSWFGSAAALMLMTAVFPRVQWKYHSPRAYLTVLVDAGHVCQTFCLVATWLGLAPFCTMALADSKIERDLGIDGVRESVLYAAGVGARPEGAGWAPWPSRAYGRRIPNLPSFGAGVRQ
ncbi:MAG TPA: SagB/ThcOx family dehydrogenase [Candidatus Acidoferrales bacterium]|nr:SagB/ThcOx family dehydrogenase [Candidatus Acidoferrales bacterium]